MPADLRSRIDAYVKKLRREHPGLNITKSDAIRSLYGTNPSYLDLMQSTFTRAKETALLASLSYDFAELDLESVKLIVNFAAGFDGEIRGERRDAQELDVTLDYRVGAGLLRNLWIRARASWLHEEGARQDGSDLRLILRYDVPLI